MISPGKIVAWANRAMRAVEANRGEAAVSDVAYDQVVQAMFEGVLGRSIDPADLERYVVSLRSGASLKQMIRDLCQSDEFLANQPKSNDLVVSLPDLTKLHPDRYRQHDDNTMIFEAKDDDGIAFMEKMISEHRYYDSFGIWAPEIDTDKKITAAIVESLGANSVVELGCFSGAALSLMKKSGLEVRGVEVSHRAFLLAEESIVGDIVYGDLLETPVDRTFDAFLGMDVLEHLSPVKLDKYVAKISQLINENGFAYINSPMFGPDRTFGEVFAQYLPSWKAAGDTSYWYEMHCDAMGWPMHGHLVWASPRWWEDLFARHGLIRDDVAEAMLQEAMNPFFLSSAPARKSLFVLRASKAVPDYALLGDRISKLIAPLIG